MGRDRCGQRLSGRFAQAPGGRDCSAGHARGRDHGYERDHGRDCNQGRGRVLAGSCELLRDVIAGNYLAITRHVHALSEQPAGFYYALQAIGNGLVRFIQGFDDLS